MSDTYHYDDVWSNYPPTAERILAALRPGHPRLMLDGTRLEAIRALVARDPVAARVQARVQAMADGLLDEPVSAYCIYDGRRLLAVSRAVKERVYALALTYRLAGG